jgi:AraC-like DNA-binding protein
MPPRPTAPGHAREDAHLSVLPDLDHLELLEAAYETQTFSPHMHETFSVGVIEKGACRFRYRRATHRAPQGSVVILQPGEIHDGRPDAEGGLRYRMLYPSTALVAQARLEAGLGAGLAYFPAPAIVDTQAARAVAALHRTLAGGADLLRRESMLLETLVFLLRRHSRAAGAPTTPRKPPRFALRRAREYLDAHARNVSLRELSQVAGLSAYHLLRAFRAAYGLTPHAYAEHRRLQEARTLLRQGMRPADAALEVGFVDQSHFTNRFKRVTGVTPGRYGRDRNFLQDASARPA